MNKPPTVEHTHRALIIMQFRSFEERKNLDDIDVTQISAIAVLAPEEMERCGYAKQSGLVFYGAGENVQMYGDPDAVLETLRAQGVELINFPQHHYFVHPHKVSYFRQLRAHSISGVCSVEIGVQGVRHKIDQSMTPEQAAGFQQVLLKTGKPLFVRETTNFNDAPSVRVQTATGFATIKQTQYPWDFPAQMLVIDPAQTGLIRSTERTLCVAFNECSCLTLDKGETHAVPGLRESFTTMYPDDDSEAISWRMKEFYEQKSLESLRALGADLAKVTPHLTAIPGSAHLVCAKPAEVQLTELGEGNRLWVSFREAMHNFTGADYGFWMDFKTPAERNAALQILRP